MKTTLPPILRTLGALFALSLSTACQFGEDSEAQNIPVRVERTADAFEISWQGDKVHRVSVIQCDAAPSDGSCHCSGSLVWGLGAADSEKFEQVALEAPFLASPIQYGEAPSSDRKGYSARSLEKGKQYLVEIARVGPCEINPEGCMQYTAVGCQSFTW